MKTIECLCHGTIGLIVSPWKINVLIKFLWGNYQPIVPWQKHYCLNRNAIHNFNILFSACEQAEFKKFCNPSGSWSWQNFSSGLQQRTESIKLIFKRVRSVSSIWHHKYHFRPKVHFIRSILKLHNLIAKFAKQFLFFLLFSCDVIG